VISIGIRTIVNKCRNIGIVYFSVILVKKSRNTVLAQLKLKV